MDGAVTKGERCAGILVYKTKGRKKKKKKGGRKGGYKGGSNPWWQK